MCAVVIVLAPGLLEMNLGLLVRPHLHTADCAPQQGVALGSGRVRTGLSFCASYAVTVVIALNISAACAVKQTNSQDLWT